MNSSKIIEINGYQLKFILIEPGTYTIGLTPEQTQQSMLETGDCAPIKNDEIQTQTQKLILREDGFKYACHERIILFHHE